MSRNVTAANLINTEDNDNEKLEAKSLKRASLVGRCRVRVTPLKNRVPE